MALPSLQPGHSRRGVDNVVKLSGANLSSLHSAPTGAYPSSVEGSSLPQSGIVHLVSVVQTATHALGGEGLEKCLIISR